MTLSDSQLSDRLLQAGGAHARAACRRCGGSGMLRLADQRYRTCLDCLGQGCLDPVQVQPVAVADLQPVAPALAVNLSAVSSAR